MRRLVGFVACAALLLGSACSSSAAKSASPTTLAPTTKAAFVARANAICTTMNSQAARVADPGNDRVKLAAAVDKIAAITSDALRKVRALPQPSGGAQRLNAIYSKLDAVLAQWARLASAARAGDQRAAISAQTKVTALLKQANAASNAYGLTVCGESH
jgi:hypothetical protein